MPLGKARRDKAEKTKKDSKPDKKPMDKKGKKSGY
jgi:hypothetical protein